MSPVFIFLLIYIYFSQIQYYILFLCFYFIDVGKRRISVQTDGDVYLYEENHFLCEDIGAVVGNGLKVVNQYDLPQVFHNRISHIDDEIWAPCRGNSINVFALNGIQRKVQVDHKDIIVVKKAFNGDVIAAGKTGLWVMDRTSSEWKKIADGYYSHIFVSRTELFALRYKQLSLQPFNCCKIYWILIVKPGRWCQSSLWRAFLKLIVIPQDVCLVRSHNILP